MSSTNVSQYVKQNNTNENNNIEQSSDKIKSLNSIKDQEDGMTKEQLHQKITQLQNNYVSEIEKLNKINLKFCENFLTNVFMNNNCCT